LAVKRYHFPAMAVESTGDANGEDLQQEARWPALVAALAVGGLYTALPASLAVGPRWLQLVIVGVLLIPTFISHRRGHHRLNQVLGQLLAAVMTAFMVWSLALLVVALPAHKEEPVTMLRSAIALWVTNILIFALWYWRLDGDGPTRRLTERAGEPGAFLFPQFTLNHAGKSKTRWTPIFIDYLFLAFNTNTAFSPTDAAVLSRWAKVLTMLQASISLAIIALLAARAVNIL
jgi:hypothetical protein